MAVIPLSARMLLVLLLIPLTAQAQTKADCSLSRVKQQRALFAKTYQSGDHEAAYQQLNGFINGHECRYPIAHADDLAPQADRAGYYWLYPDLMLAQYRTGRYNACRAIGDRFLTMGDSGARRYMPSHARNAVATNLKLCEQGAHRDLLPESAMQRCAIDGYQSYWQLPPRWREGEWQPIQKNIQCVRLQSGQLSRLISKDLNYQTPKDTAMGLAHQPRLEVVYLNGEDTQGQAHYGHQSLFIYEQQLVDERVGRGWGKAEDFSAVDRLFPRGHCGQMRLRFGQQPGQLTLIGDSHSCRAPEKQYTAKTEWSLSLQFPFYLQLDQQYQVPIR